MMARQRALEASVSIATVKMFPEARCIRLPLRAAIANAGQQADGASQNMENQEREPHARPFSINRFNKESSLHLRRCAINRYICF
jgi:hypothetical protein